MAATTRDIRRRIRSVRNTQQITKAMKMVAASKLRKAQTRLMAVRPYQEALAARLRLVLLRLSGDESPLLVQQSGQAVALLVISGDKGLCGSFTHNILKQAETFLDQHAGRDIHVTAVGRKGAQQLAKLGYEPEQSYTGMSENVTMAQAGLIMRRLVDGYLEGRYAEVHVIYSFFSNAVSQQIRTERLLPLALTADDDSAAAPQHEVLMEPSPQEVCKYLLTESLNVRLFRSLLETASSEHGARMTSMDNATNNADELISELTLIYNRVRQAAITTEISEIVGGAEALSHGR